VFSIAVDKSVFLWMKVSVTNLQGTTFLIRECTGVSEYFFNPGALEQGTYILKIRTDKAMLVKRIVHIK
jgi:hypothetical protein